MRKSYFFQEWSKINIATCLDSTEASRSNNLHLSKNIIGLNKYIYIYIYIWSQVHLMIDKIKFGVETYVRLCPAVAIAPSIDQALL